MADHQQQHTIIATAVVIDPTNNTNNHHHHNPPPIVPADETIPFAATLHQYEDASPTVQERDVSRKAAEASEKGYIAAILEKRQIQRENRKIASKHGATEAQRIKVASEIGKTRDKISARDRNKKRTPKDAPTAAVAVIAPKDTDTNCQLDYKPTADLLDDVDKGYQVGEYNVEAFKGDAYDDTYQYKSVYE
eukprot:CAMPEP_0198249620 /NCGR_PEP_ID=MMETSP1447-20131203/1093_1 /TAXON_ID=420782 /ORGANISM="Chaetoceros dichaeta, Strain CCMP1751" /LENGTH=191 /DNA_ID=CAMNT_0043934299 /DNA_START=43 /DNA_END=618 /DNA_ORIENTATION=+